MLLNSGLNGEATSKEESIRDGAGNYKSKQHRVSRLLWIGCATMSGEEGAGCKAADEGTINDEAPKKNKCSQSARSEAMG